MPDTWCYEMKYEDHAEYHGMHHTLRIRTASSLPQFLVLLHPARATSSSSRVGQARPQNSQLTGVPSTQQQCTAYLCNLCMPRKTKQKHPTGMYDTSPIIFLAILSPYIVSHLHLSSACAAACTPSATHEKNAAPPPSHPRTPHFSLPRLYRCHHGSRYRWRLPRSVE